MPQLRHTPFRQVICPPTVLPWTVEAAEAYGELRATCEAGGVTLAPMDMMIAAHDRALAVVKGQDQTILVTRDGAFSRACGHGGFILEDWTQEASA